MMERGPADMVFALALVHHLAISNNVPLKKIAEFFSQISNFLIIEFIPKSDSQVKRLLLTRDDIFDDYAIYKKLFDDNQRTYFTREESAELYDGIYKMMDEIKKRVQYLEDFIFEKSPVDRHGKDPREDDMPF